MTSLDATWSESVAYACPCGTMYAVTYWRWVDANARPGLVESVRSRGAYEGTCPGCGALPRGQTPYVVLDVAAGTASLMIPEERRGDIVAILKDHVDGISRRPEAAAMYLLAPSIEFVAIGEEQTSPRARAALRPSAPSARAGELEVAATTAGPQPETTPIADRGGTAPQGPVPVASQPARDSRPRPAGVPAGVPQVIGRDSRSPTRLPTTSLGGYVSELESEAGSVVFRVDVGDAFSRWQDAKLDARPMHLRARGYPLVGVRIVGAYMGQVGVLDAVLDAGGPASGDIFRRLSEEFVVQVRIVGADGEKEREVKAPGLEANAALCIESARGLLAHGEYPPADYDNAKAVLAAESVDQRLAPTKVTIAPGVYQHIIGAREAVAALDHLDRVSRKDSLSRLLEVDGLPMGEYDAIRRRVLQGSLEHGLVAPRRFWRRVVASGLATDLRDYANRLASARAEHQGEEGDLDAEQATAAWMGILDLCQRKDIAPPEPLRLALDLDSGSTPAPRGQASAAGEIGGEAADALDARLRDPMQRLKAATDVLQGRSSVSDLDRVFLALDQFDTDELLALLPDLSELGPRAVPGLVPKLSSVRREVRQAAAILLGMALDPDALEPLADRLVREETNVWLDIARALGAFGPVALRRLCQILRREAGTASEPLAVERVARALAEIALSDGEIGPGDPSPGHDAVAALADAGDPRVCSAARRALGTLQLVSESGAAIRGELPLAEDTEIRGFARRAYEAIMVPELEVEAEA